MSWIWHTLLTVVPNDLSAQNLSETGAAEGNDQIMKDLQSENAAKERDLLNLSSEYER